MMEKVLVEHQDHEFGLGLIFWCSLGKLSLFIYPYVNYLFIDQEQDEDFEKGRL